MTQNPETSNVDEIQTMVRTQIAVNDAGFFLAQGQNVDDLKAQVLEAVLAGGLFVEFVVVGNRSVSVLVSAASQVVITVDTVQFDHRDTGDEDAPFGGVFDLL